MAQPEILHPHSERTAEIEKAAGEQAERLRREKGEKLSEGEDRTERTVEAARTEAEKQAKPAEEYRPASEREAPGSTSIHAKNPEEAYERTMVTVRQEMSAPSRAFSKLIHNKAVEKTSDIAGSTVARPNAVLSGAICAFLFVLALYMHARYVGYALSGFESIAAFIVGWVIGIVFDVARIALKRKS